jgi:hypothetical protein
MHISKIEAAQRQLNSAIILYFMNSDDVSVCTLLHSSWNILKDLLKERDCTRNWIAEEYARSSGEPKSKFWDFLQLNWNFLKHANQDPKAILVFDNEYLWGGIAFAIHDFIQLGKPTPAMEVFQIWVCAKSPLPDDIEPTPESIQMINTAAKIFPKMHFKNEVEQRRLGLLAVELLMNRNEKIVK